MHRFAPWSIGVLLASCVPPPFALVTEGTHRDELHSISAGGYLAYTGDYTSTPYPSSSEPMPMRNEQPSMLFGSRLSYQVDRNLALGGDSVGAISWSPAAGTSALGLAAMRFHARIHPDSDHVAFVVGGGAGFGVAPNGMNYATQPFLSYDGGVRVGTRVAESVDLYASQTVGQTWYLVPLRPTMPAMGSRDWSWAIHSITEVGAIYRASENVGLGAHLSMLYTAFENGGQQRPSFVPSVSLRYTWSVDHDLRRR